MDKDISYEVVECDPYDKVHELSDLESAIRFAKECYNFVSLTKVVRTDITKTITELKKLV